MAAGTTSSGPRIIWAPQPGSQVHFLSCPHFECLYHGTRGPGKTDSLLMDFAQFTGQGFGPSWRGILFRETYKQLADVEAKSRKWFSQIFPDARFAESKMTWTWPDGEELLFRYIEREADYWNYHGHEYPWIGFEELTNWADAGPYLAMMSCCRSSHPGMPRRYRATANPYGVGHSWVKERFIDTAPALTPVQDDGGRARCHVYGSIYENKILLEADPEYLKTLESITDPNLRKAWLEGSWDIVAGGMFTDVWREEFHLLEPFNIPEAWVIRRSFDWGSAKPFSVAWWAVCDGTEAENGFCPPRGTVIRIEEFYGWNGKANQGCGMLASDIAKEIHAKEKSMLASGVIRTAPKPGPADSAIFSVENGMCIASDFERAGVVWERASKGPGSRVNGWQLMRQRLKASTVRPMEEPGMFMFNTCRHLARTLPVAPRDEKKLDDIHTDFEDHALDEARYFVTALNNEILDWS